MNNKNKRRNYTSCVVEKIESATFCNKMSPHQELVDKIHRFDLSAHTPHDCLNFVCELKRLVESYG